MAKTEFNVSINPIQAANVIKDRIGAELIDEDTESLGNGRYLIVLVFEKYFFRVSSRASLVVVISNYRGSTNVKAIGSGGGNGMIFKFDWGASQSFESEIYDLLSDYIA